MTSIRKQFDENFSYNYFGRITGTYNPSQFPNIHGRLARLKADPNNSYIFWFGSPRTTGSIPPPWPLAAGDDTGWFAMNSTDSIDSLGNLNALYCGGCSGTTYISYWIQE